MLDLSVLAEAPLTTAPFPFLTATGVLSPFDLHAIARDFPRIDDPGLFPLSELTYGLAFGHLIDDIQSDRLEALLAQKFSLSLADKPLMITVRGHCQRKDGRIHTDSKDKLLTCLLYLNSWSWQDEGGCLRFLTDGDSLDGVIAEVAPEGGNFVAFQRTERSWHGHAPFVGPRRYVMFNWLSSDLALGKNLGRHRWSAAVKRLGLWHGA